MLLTTTMTDPGIIPRIPDPTASMPFIYRQMMNKHEGRRKYLLKITRLMNSLQKDPSKITTDDILAEQLEGGSNDFQHDIENKTIENLSVRVDKSIKSISVS